MKIFTPLVLTGLIFLSSFFNTAIAQDLLGIRDSIYSEILKENRIIQVILPENYKPGSLEKYDVLYMLDGEWTTKLASQIQPFVAHEKFMPASIIIGIINVDRNRDFLPTKMDNLPTSGGADKFLSFLKDELIPYVNKSYPSNGENTLFGASFGGVMAMYAFLKDPEVFDPISQGIRHFGGTIMFWRKWPGKSWTAFLV